MIRDITIGQYYNGDSFLHKCDPRTKILMTFGLIVAIFLCKNFVSIGIMIFFTVLCVAFSSVPVKMYLKSLKPLLILILFTAVLNLLYSTGGDVVVQFWKIKITDKALFNALFIIIRIICLIVCSSVMTYTTTPTMLTDAIEKLLSPLNVLLKPFNMQVHTLAMMMTLALRFIPTLIEEIDKITNAQKARGAELDAGKFTDRIKALIPIIIPLFVSSFRRAYELAFAMDCRCYRGGEGRTRMKKMKFGFRDLIVTVLFCAAAAGIVVTNIKFGSVL
ncbi:MAG: energy-coupling factor transporter transmembrane protein EcfT [Clostridia bacterium]|nr:energy-coupling factor transporter transmembrane protein EcfT [Clostridia bacterium]